MDLAIYATLPSCQASGSPLGGAAMCTRKSSVSSACGKRSERVGAEIKKTVGAKDVHHCQKPDETYVKCKGCRQALRERKEGGVGRRRLSCRGLSCRGLGCRGLGCCGAASSCSQGRCRGSGTPAHLLLVPLCYRFVLPRLCLMAVDTLPPHRLGHRLFLHWRHCTFAVVVLLAAAQERAEDGGDR